MELVTAAQLTRIHRFNLDRLIARFARHSDCSAPGRPDTDHIIRCLWVPCFTRNRTAVINLNHALHGINEAGLLIGSNWNCRTPYVILPIPDSWNQIQVDLMAFAIARQLRKPLDYPTHRVLKADRRIDLIANFIAHF